MNIGEYSVTNKVTTWLIVILFIAGGLTALSDISRLEDPEFTIKDAKIYTTYPGATAKEVEREITYHIENAIQAVSYTHLTLPTTDVGCSFGWWADD